MNLQISQWKQFRIGEISEIQYGSSLKFTEGLSGYKTFRMNEILDGIAFDNGEMKRTVLNPSEFAKYCLNYGDILFNRTNSFEHVGRTGIFLIETDEYMFASYLLRLSVDKTKVSPFYLNVLMNSNWFQTNIKRLATKAVNQANINAKSLASFQIPIPPLDEQQQIFDLFQSIDTSIEQNEEQGKNLRGLKKRLVDDLLSDKPTFGKLLEFKELSKVNFAEVTDCIEQHKKESLPLGLTRFVGLEHIEPENFKISTWGNIEDGTTFTKTFASGDVLFGKRRSYLKKVAIAEFDGICSSDILVFRAKENKMLAELLPFYVASEAFIQLAVNTSAGSLSPRTKWRDLAKFELSIPDLETQSKILEGLQQIQKTIEQTIEQKQTLKNLKFKLLNEILG
jgi:type I restriction enzyme S subunit